MGQVYEDNSSRWEQQPDGSFTHLPKQKQPPTSLGSVKEAIAANAADIQQNASDVLANTSGLSAVTSALNDMKVVTSQMPMPTLEAGWSANSVESWRSGSVAWFRFYFSRTGADITMNTAGQISDFDVFTIDSAWLPQHDINAWGQTGYAGYEGTLSKTTGKWNLRSGTANSTIATNYNLTVDVGPYLLANTVQPSMLSGRVQALASVGVLPTVSLAGSGSQTIPNQFTTPRTTVTAWSVADDPASMYQGNGLISIPTSGYYLAESTIVFQGSTSGFRATGWKINGGNGTHEVSARPDSIASVRVHLNNVRVFKLDSGDTLEAWAYQNSGGTLDIYTGSPHNATLTVKMLPDFNNAEDTGWLAPTLVNGYTNYSASWEQAGYRRLNGVVHLRGLLNPPSVSGSPSVPAFTLPVGFRPAQSTHYVVYALTNPYVCQVMTDGLVQFRRYSSGDGSENTSYVSLSGVTFVADQ